MAYGRKNSENKPLQNISPKHPAVKSPLRIYAPEGLYLEIVLKYKIKQSKNVTVTQFFLKFAFQP